MRGKERSGQRSPWNGPAIGSGRVTGRPAAAGWRADATHGDELGHSQYGNNAYCQDNELSWLDWERADDQLLAFCADIVAFRRRHPAFRRRRFFEERPIFSTELSDIGWFRPDGQEMTPDGWQTGFVKSLGVFLTLTRCPTPTGEVGG